MFKASYFMSLSKKQNKRLGTLLSVMFQEELPEDALVEVKAMEVVEISEGKPRGTEKGLDEKNRLCTLAGLNIKYASELKKANPS